LASIVASAALLLRSPKISEAGGHEQKRARTIQSSAAHMAVLLDDLCDVASINAGRPRLEDQAGWPAADLMREARELFAPLAANGARRIVATALPPPGVEVTCDRDRVFQVLSNLIGNALKFTAEGATVALGAEAAAGEVLFTVSDTGPGLAPEQIPHVFERN